MSDNDPRNWPRQQEPECVVASGNLGRPIPDAMAEVKEAAEKISALIDAWKEANEIKVVIDLLKTPGVFTLHIPIPKS